MAVNTANISVVPTHFRIPNINTGEVVKDVKTWSEVLDSSVPRWLMAARSLAGEYIRLPFLDLEEGVYVSGYGTEEVQILAAHRIKAVLSNSTFLDVVMFLTLPRHAAGGWTQVGKPTEAHTNMGVLSAHMHIGLLLSTCFKRVHVRAHVCLLATQWSS